MYSFLRFLLWEKMGGWFSTSSYPSLSPELSPWRKVTWSEKDEILPHLEAFTASSEDLKIMLCGPVGAGKSCFINSVQRVLLGRNFIGALEQSAHTGTSFTLTIKTHKMKKRGGGRFPFLFKDIMGLQIDDVGGIQTSDVSKVLKGHILDGYTFNPMTSITKDHPRYNPNPHPGDKVHCLVYIVPADYLSIIDPRMFEKMKIIRAKAAKLNIPQVVIMTKVDLACEMVDQDLKKIYQSRKIKEKAQDCSNKLGISLNNIYPVKNYYAEITQNDETDVLILMALRDIVNFANDYVEDIEDA